MEDFKFLFYIILAIIYFIVTNYKKFRKKAAEAEFENSHPEVPSVNLEEILQQHLPKAQTLKNKKRYETKLTPEFSGAKGYKLEQTDIKALSLEKREEAALARKVSSNLEDERKAFERKQPKKVHPIAAQLQNPASIRNAVILSEVLNRKEY